ncbi:MAG TPA: hypothetical protein DCQ06_14195, partial [Myxococcales bacterium]|nr:hypothetical protein [Myxococcales bacterium]
MKSEPRLPDELVNQGGQRPIQDLIVLMSAAFAVLVALVIAVGLLTDVVVRLVPRERESTLLRPVVSAFLDDFGEGEAAHEAHQALQALFDKVRAVVEPMPYEFQLKLACTPMVNAMALPGGGIVVTSGLLKLLRNEDELSFVLAHELGHFVGRDHLQGLGRGLTLGIALGIG